MKVLVLGDRIIDHYTFCKATRLCPEGPAPVLVPIAERVSEGGAGLVAANLRSLIGDQQSVEFFYGSTSEKRRIFADHTLICRIDKDNVSSKTVILENLDGLDAVVVGDYGKGTMDRKLAFKITDMCKGRDIPLFVDAKADPTPYRGCFAIMPNELEHPNLNRYDYKHLIRKLGAKGCSVDGIMVHTDEQQVFDVTGAGDVFIAAFVTRFLRLKENVGALKVDCGQVLVNCAEYANKAAGISVKHLGTYIVKPEELM